MTNKACLTNKQTEADCLNIWTFGIPYLQLSQKILSTIIRHFSDFPRRACLKVGFKSKNTFLCCFREKATEAEAAVYVASDVHLHRLDGGHLYHVGGDCNCDHVRSHDCTHRGQSNDLKVGPGYAHIHHHVHIHDTAPQGETDIHTVNYPQVYGASEFHDLITHK